MDGKDYKEFHGTCEYRAGRTYIYQFLNSICAVFCIGTYYFNVSKIDGKEITKK